MILKIWRIDLFVNWHIWWICQDFHKIPSILIFTVRKRSLRRLCFYTCLSFCPRRGGCLSPGPVGGVCPGGCPGPGLGGVQAQGGCVSQHALRQTPPPPADGYCCGRYASYWNALLFNFSISWNFEIIDIIVPLWALFQENRNILSELIVPTCQDVRSQKIHCNA